MGRRCTASWYNHPRRSYKASENAYAHVQWGHKEEPFSPKPLHAVKRGGLEIVVAISWAWSDKHEDKCQHAKGGRTEKLEGELDLSWIYTNELTNPGTVISIELWCEITHLTVYSFGSSITYSLKQKQCFFSVKNAFRWSISALQIRIAQLIVPVLVVS